MKDHRILRAFKFALSLPLTLGLLLLEAIRLRDR